MARRLAAVVVAAMVAAGCDADPGYQGRSSREWITQLADTAAAGRADAAYALGRSLALQPNAPAVVDALVGALADTSDAVRVAAAAALSNAGRRASAAAPGVARLLADSAHPHVRRQAVVVLRALGSASAGASVPALTPVLRDPDPEVRRAAAEALGSLGAAAVAATPGLAALTTDPNPDVRLRALEAVGRVAPGSEAAAPLARALSDPVPAVRAAAAGAIGHLRDRAAPAVPALITAMRDSAPHVRAAAAVALGLTDPVRGEAALRAARRDPDPLVRREAEHALSAVHQRGGQDEAPSEPTADERCPPGAGRTRAGC